MTLGLQQKEVVIYAESMEKRNTEELIHHIHGRIAECQSVCQE